METTRWHMLRLPDDQMGLLVGLVKQAFDAKSKAGTGHPLRETELFDELHQAYVRGRETPHGSDD